MLDMDDSFTFKGVQPKILTKVPNHSRLKSNVKNNQKSGRKYRDNIVAKSYTNCYGR